MRIGVWITLAALALAGCTQDNTNRPAANSNSQPAANNNQNKPVTTQKPAVGAGETPATSAAPNTRTSTTTTNEPKRPDNTGVNERDRDNKTVLPTDQGNNQADVDRTAEIRREVLKIENLSVNGRNVKIITNNGKVMLRGPVASDSELKAIEDVANRIAGKDNVTNALEVAP